MSIRPRPLGKTGLFVSELSLGTWGLSGDGYGPIEAAEAESILRRAVDIGVTLIDTSDAYGGGAMEALLGRLLKTAASVVVVTKLAPIARPIPPRKRFDAAYLRERVEASLQAARAATASSSSSCTTRASRRSTPARPAGRSKR